MSAAIEKIVHQKIQESSKMRDLMDYIRKQLKNYHLDREYKVTVQFFFPENEENFEENEDEKEEIESFESE